MELEQNYSASYALKNPSDTTFETLQKYVSLSFSLSNILATHYNSLLLCALIYRKGDLEHRISAASVAVSYVICKA